MSKVLIRHPDMDELSDCVSVFFKAFNKPQKNLKDLSNVWRNAIKTELLELLVLEKNKKIIGLGGLVFHGGLAWIGYMATDPYHQKQGVGSMIFRSLLERSGELGYNSNALFANEIGKKLYTKFGFKEILNVKRYTLDLLDPPKELIDIKPSSLIPEWVYLLDKEINGFDRRRFLDYIISLNSKVLTLDSNSYCFVTGSLIGPVVTKTSNQAITLTIKAYQIGGKRIIIPQSKIDKFNHHFLIQEDEGGKHHYMIRGEKIPTKFEFIYGYYSYGTG